MTGANPLDPPSQPPSAAPVVSISVNAEWLPFLLGLSEQLDSPAYWAVTPEQWASYLQQWVEELIDILSEAS